MFLGGELRALPVAYGTHSMSLAMIGSLRQRNIIHIIIAWENLNFAIQKQVAQKLIDEIADSFEVLA